MGRGKGGRTCSEAGIVVAPPSSFSLLDSGDLSLRSQLEPVEV